MGWVNDNGDLVWVDDPAQQGGVPIGPVQQPAPSYDPMVTGSFASPHSLGWLTQNDPGAAIGQQTQDTVATRQQTQDYINNVIAPAVRNGQGANEDIRQGLSDSSGKLWNATQGYVGQNNALGQQAQDVANWANGQDQSTLADYTGANRVATDLTGGLFNNMLAGYGNFSQLSASPYVGDAQSNAGDISRQLASYGDLSSIGAGSLNYQSQGAQAYANPQDIANQNQANAFFQSGMAGGLNYASQASNAYASADSLQNQSMAESKLRNGANGAYNTASLAEHAQADPRAIETQWDAVNRLGGLVNSSFTPGATANDSAGLAAQKDALSQYKALTNPEVTAQERFIYEQARMRQEQDERNSRSAVMSDLRARGMSGSGMELTSMLGLQQQQSQNRLLSDLGAESNAVSRQMQALQGYGSLGTNMQAQAQQALGMYTDAAGQLRSQTFDEAYKRGLAGDNTAIANANRMLQAAGMDAEVATNMRNQSFNEAFGRGQAADQASQFNSQIKLASGQQFANLSTNMRNAGFNEAYSRGTAADAASANNQATMLGGTIGAANQSNSIRTANDAMTAFNKGQQRLYQEFGDKYRADQQNDAATRLNNMTVTGEGLVNDNMGRASDLAAARSSTTNTAAGRQNKAIDFNAGRNDADLGAQQNWTNTNASLGSIGAGINQNAISNSLALGQLGLGNTWQGLGAQGQAINGGVGWQQGIAAGKQADEAVAQAAATGPLGLPDPIGYTRYKVLKK